MNPLQTLKDNLLKKIELRKNDIGYIGSDEQREHDKTIAFLTAQLSGEFEQALETLNARPSDDVKLILSGPAMQDTDLPEFIVKTNTDYADWCASFYEARALDEHGQMSLHGLWAWQEQERRLRKSELTDVEIDAVYYQATGQHLRAQDKRLAYAFARELLKHQ
jgi:hypothetical protein